MTAPEPTGRQTVLVALAQGALMAIGAVLSLLVARAFGRDAETDAFFAAYGFYGVGVTLAHTFRLTAVPALVRAPGPETATRLLAAVGVVALAAAVPMLALAGPLGALLVENDPTGVAPDTLRILWLTLAGQLLAAMLATILAVRGAFTTIAVATLTTGFASLVVFAVLQGPVGIQAAALGLAATAVLLALALGGSLLRSGWRPRWTKGVSLATEAGRLSFASATFFAANFSYVICVAVAAHHGTGEATAFAYAFMLAIVLVGVTANVNAMVRSPSLVAGEDRSERTAETTVLSFRYTLVLIGPVLAMTLLVGEPVIEWALGADFGAEGAHRIVVTLACLIVWILGSAGAVFAVVELLARGELTRLAALGAVQVAVTFGAALAGAAIAGTPGIAAALSLTAAATALIQLRWAFGALFVSTITRMGQAVGRELVVLAIAFAPAALLPSDVAAGVLAAALAIAATYVAWPRERRVLLGLVR